MSVFFGCVTFSLFFSFSSLCVRMHMSACRGSTTHFC